MTDTALGNALRRVAQEVYREGDEVVSPTPSDTPRSLIGLSRALVYTGSRFQLT